MGLPFANYFFLENGLRFFYLDFLRPHPQFINGRPLMFFRFVPGKYRHSKLLASKIAANLNKSLKNILSINHLIFCYCVLSLCIIGLISRGAKPKRCVIKGDNWNVKGPTKNLDILNAEVVLMTVLGGVPGPPQFSKYEGFELGP